MNPEDLSPSLDIGWHFTELGGELVLKGLAIFALLCTLTFLIRHLQKDF